MKNKAMGLFPTRKICRLLNDTVFVYVAVSIPTTPNLTLHVLVRPRPQFERGIGIVRPYRACRWAEMSKGIEPVLIDTLSLAR